MSEPPANTQSHAPSFREAAEAAARRIVHIRWVRALRKSLWVVVAALVLLLIVRLLGSAWGHPLVALLTIALWIGVCFLWARQKRPTPFAALSRWDESAGRKEEFASAWFFENEPNPAPAAELHVDRAQSKLGDARPNLPKDLPLRFGRPYWIFLILLTILIALPMTRPAARAGDTPITEEMIATAEDESDRLGKRDRELQKMDSLTEEEKKEIEKLQEAIDSTAEGLKDSEGLSAREVLSELEKRAREAEKMAASMGEDGASWASAEMTSEMMRHADTADLGEAVQNKDAEPAAAQANDLAKKLADNDLASDTKERIAEALERIQEQAEEEDAERLVGKPVGEAADAMAEDQPAAAAEDFAKLAESLKSTAERQKAQEALEKLAEQLREAGANIAGQNVGGMEKLAGNENGAAGQQSMPNMTPMGAGQQMPPGAMPPPGMQNMPQGQMGQMGQMPPPGQMPQGGQQPPVPGTGQMGQMAQMPPGQQPGQNGQGQPMLSAPIPGTQPGQTPGAGAGPPTAMIPGAAPGGAPGGPGMSIPVPGNQAGVGTAALGADPTKTIASSNQGMVAAQIGRDGDSSFRAVQGGAREEEAQRTASNIASDFIRVEEEALDEKALPLSRRDHVRRYFNTLRESFEPASP